MNKRLFNQQNLTRRLRMLPVLFAMLLMPLSAWAQTITVAGVSPDADGNFTDLSGVTFNATTNTLTLNNASIDMSEIPGLCPIESSIANLTIQLIGYNTLTPNSDNINGIRFTDGTTTGNLTFTTSNVVEGYVTLNVDGIYQFSDLTSGYNVTNSFTTEEQTGWSKIESGFSGGTYNYVRIDYTEYYDVWIGGARLSSSNLSPVSGGTEYIPSTHTLHLAGYGYSDEIKSGLPEFIVEVSGSYNYVSDISFEGDTPGTIIFKKDESSLTGNNMVEFTGSVKNFSSVTITAPLQLVSPSGYSNPTSEQWNSFENVKIADYVTTYDISVAGNNVTNANASDVLGDGTVSYDSENNILTLTNASITPEVEVYGISYSGIDNLTIRLNGTNNVVKGGGGCNAILYDGVGAAAPTLTFTNGGTEPCSVLLEAVGNQTIAEFGSVVNTGLYKIDETILGADQDNIYRTTISSTLLSGGTGTSNDPFLIKTKEDLVSFANYVNDGVITTEYVKLDADINCSELTGFEPIGTSDYPFTGTFTNSNNYTISNLNCSVAGADGYIGLFGQIGSNGTTSVAGSVSGLKLNNCSFSGGSVGGAIAGYLSYGTISGCLVTNSSVTTSSGDAPTSAGIVGESFGTITNCTVSGSTITASTAVYDASTTAGGIAGTNGGTISNCEVTGTSEHSTLIKSSYNDSSSDASRNAGGIVGNCIDDNANTITISGNSVKGVTTVRGEDSDGAAQAGAIIGHCPNNSIKLANNFYDYTVKTIIINGDDEDERTGYMQRGSGDFTYDQTTGTNVYTDITENNGAVMYTKLLALPVEGPSGTVMGDEGGFYAYADGEIFGILGAPGHPVKVTVTPDDNCSISAISVTYGTDQTAAIELTKTEEGTYYYTISEMPDANATLNVTFSQGYDLWIGETQVTDANKDHILGEENTTVTFAITGNEAAGYVNTLTLNGFEDDCSITSGLDNLNVVLTGSNSVENIVYSGEVSASISFSGTGSLDFYATSVPYGFTNVTYGDNLAMKVTSTGAHIITPLEAPVFWPTFNDKEQRVIELRNYFADATVTYSLTYANTSLASQNKTDETYTEAFVLKGPATITTKATIGSKVSAVATAYYFGAETNPMKFTYGDSFTAPTLVPNVEGVSILADSYESSVSLDGVATLNNEHTSFTLNGVGKGLAYARVGYPEKINYTVLNATDSLGFCIEVVPPEPAIAFDNDKTYLDTDNIVISLDETYATYAANNNVTNTIYYSWAENPTTGTVYSEGSVTAQTGTLTAWVVATVSSKNYESAKATQEFTAKTDISGYIVSGLAESETYTGTAIVPDFTVKATATATTSLTANTDYTVSYKKVGETLTDVTSMVDAGSYKIIITGTGNYGGSISKDFEIKKAYPWGTGWTAPTAKTGLTYNNEVKDLITGATVPDGVTVKYYCKFSTEEFIEEELYNIPETAEWTTTVPQGTNAGYYAVFYKVEESANYESWGPCEVPLQTSIAKAAIEAVTVNITGWEFGGYNATTNAPSVTTASNPGNGEVTYLYKEDKDGANFSDDVPTAVGAYIVQATVAETANYLSKTGTTTFSITAKSITDEMVTLSATSFVYSGEAQAPTVTVTDGEVNLTGDDYTYAIKQGETAVTSPTNVGSYDVVVTGKGNYTGTVTKSFTIDRLLDISFSASNKWVTYCGTENLATPEGLKAYQVTAVSGSTVTIAETGYIPANTAVLLQNVSNNNTWSNIAASAYTGATSTFESNKLIGAASAVGVSSISGGTVYILYNDMFRRTTSGTIPANRGYLVVAASAVNAGSAPQLSITIGDDTTGIGSVDCDSVATDNDEWYTLDGQKLQQAPTRKGLYIKNGKKVVINKK